MTAIGARRGRIAALKFAPAPADMPNNDADARRGGPPVPCPVAARSAEILRKAR